MAQIDTLRALDAQLKARREFTDLFEQYYDGQHRLAYATAKFKDAFGTLFKSFADNWCAVIVDSAAERLSVEGFTIGEETDEANGDAWNVWIDNGMELQSSIAMLGAIKTGSSYVVVDTTGEKPEIRVWPSSMAIVKRDPKSRKVIAALTRWAEDDGAIGAALYEPDEITLWTSISDKQTGVSDPIKRKWDKVGTIDNPSTDGTIPVVEILNRPDELMRPKADLGDVLPMQDAINKLANDMIVASEFQAFRQRVLTGVEIPKNPETGVPLPSQQIEAAISRLWAFENENAKVHDLPATDLSNYVSGIKELLTHLAGQTRTPPHYLLGQMVNVSGDALAAAESGLVLRVKNKHTSFAEGWREVMRIATGVDERIEIVWANPERHSLSQMADGISKLAATKELALPREELWRMLGFSPLKIKEMLKRAAEVEAKQRAEAEKIAKKQTPPPDADAGGTAPSEEE